MSVKRYANEWVRLALVYKFSVRLFMIGRTYYNLLCVYSLAFLCKYVETSLFSVHTYMYVDIKDFTSTFIHIPKCLYVGHT